MIYIDETEHGYFKSLAMLISYHLDKPCEVTTDYSKKGLWILNYWSQLYKSVYKIVANGCEYIAVQTEPLHIKGHKSYINFLNNAVEIWDYTKTFQIGYSDLFRLEMEAVKDIDILFYGKVNSKRREIISEIPKVTIIEGVYSPDIFKYIMRSKIILSLTFHDKSNADWTRIAPLLSNNAFIIAEECHDKEFNTLKDHIVIRKADEIPSACHYYLHNPIGRIKMADKGTKYIKNERHTSF